MKNSSLPQAGVPGLGKPPIPPPESNDTRADIDRLESESLPHEPSVETPLPPAATGWKALVAPYQMPAAWRSLWQIVNTLVPYAALWYLMYLSLSVSYWLTLPLILLAAGFHVRVFIIFHDCGHGSFFKSQKVADAVGFITGVLTFTPYYHWRWLHAIHHGSAGDLDRRSFGDITTWTVEEFLAASRWQRLGYRLQRNPIMLFVLAPLFVFLIKHRFVSAGAAPRERCSVYWTNLALLGLVGGIIWMIGLKAYLLIQLPLMAVSGAAGLWLFYVQHQFEDVTWARHGEWNFAAAALQGSSFYKLPRILQWFTGNIGFHHIHHLNPRIPNYNLEKCQKAVPLFQTVKPITLFSSFKSLTYRLWDEQSKKLVGYRRMRAVRRQMRLGIARK
jgi:omega-6 fatty acid desaturase (delta-12 desaturase)